MNMFLLYKVDTNDYGASWTGNYSGITFTLGGIFSTWDLAFRHLRNYFDEYICSDLPFEDWYNISDWEIKEIGIDIFINEMFLCYCPPHDDDY